MIYGNTGYHTGVAGMVRATNGLKEDIVIDIWAAH
jgi:hypothetical protein